MTERVPVFRAVVRRAAGPIVEAVTKIGGAPVFLEPAEAPECASCGQPMAFVAQVRLDAPLALSERWRMAYVFMCFSVKDEAEVHLPWESEPMRRTSLACLSFEAGSGANATLLQEASGATYIGEANAPAVLFGRVEGARYLGEPPSTRIPDFEVEFEAGSEPEIDTGDYECDEALREEVWFETKVGGVPGWIQGNTWLACPECGGETRFIGQIYDELEQWQGPGEPGLCVGFGDCGLGYLFLCAAECGPRGAAFLWTCG